MDRRLERRVAQVLQLLGMESVGLRALRQEASELVRRVENGEQIDITVSGRVAARMVPARPAQWRQWRDIAAAFTGPEDPDWEKDRDGLEQSVTNPWDGRK
jgi:prevent-host-death family protein